MVQRKKVRDLIGLTKDRLTVVEYLGIGAHDKHYWRCSCICGGEVILNSSRITGKDNTKSCGCLRKEVMRDNRKDAIRHGIYLKHRKLYNIYNNMLQRCYNKNSTRWHCYGAIGVSVCPEWLNSVEVFAKWSLENGYEEGLSIDRLDPLKGYEPENCEWVSRPENSRRMNEFRRLKKAQSRATESFIL